MEFYKTSIYGNEINVIFLGGVYVFHNDYYGYLAIAERDYNYHTRESRVNISFGNHHIGGGSMTNERLLSGVKRFITKAERKYNEAIKVTFIETMTDNANTIVKLNITHI